MKIRNALVAAAAAVFASGASAGTVSFDFRGSLTSGASLALTDVGTGLTATAYGFVAGSPSVVTRSASGYGVYQGPISDPLDLQVDGIGGTESLLVDFTPEIVTINSVSFGLVDANDDVRVSVFGAGGALVAFGDFDPAGLGTVTLDFTAINPALRKGLSFGFTSLGINDDFSVAGMTVDYSPVVVPLPPAAWAGLALMGVSVVISRSRKLAMTT